jgi:hypothetical protein
MQQVRSLMKGILQLLHQTRNIHARCLPATAMEEETSCIRKGIVPGAEQSLICSKEEFLEHYERHLPATAATEEESLSNMKSFL